MNATEAKEILERYRRGDCTAEEARLIEQWYLQLEETGDFEWLKGEKEHYAAMMWQNILERGHKEHEASTKNTKHVVPMYRRNIFKWTAAAVLLIVAGYVLWVTVGRRSQVAGDKTEIAKTNDVPAPSGTKAMITLADGSKVYLDSVSNGTIAQENNVNVVKTADGKIIYDTNAVSLSLAKTIAYNTLTNPRGSKVISLTLSDGTKVWLNSESSLRYPASFSALSAFRDVEITGEAYFEVKHNSKQPFKVHLPNGSIVEDIGTAFNINSYPDEDAIKTTLVEGSVKVYPSSRLSALAVKLKPGQQAALNTFNLQLLTFNSVDLDEVMAWKNGRFQFGEAMDVREAMRQLQRWYDIDVEYIGNVKGSIGGGISRTVNISQVLKMIEMTGTAKFKIDGRKITVMQ